MADLNKFEEMLERLVNEDKAGAEELFHEIVVEKSRSIYESLLEDEDEDDIEEATDEDTNEDDIEEATDEDTNEDDLDEGFDLEEFEVEADDEADPMDAMMGGDAADDMEGDIEMGADDEEGDDDVEDRVEDLEDALDELKAEFEKMMSGDDAGDDAEGDDMDMDDEEGDMDDADGDEEAEEESYAFEAEDEDDDEVEEADKSESETMREYVEKVSATMGDNGANTKSSVAGKNDMGGTAANITNGGESKSEGTKGGLAAPTAKEDNAGNVNVPGAKGATKTASQPGHGAEKKGKPETADKSAGSMLNGAPKRAK